MQGPTVALALHDHLLITEIVPVPTGAEYVELVNPTAIDVDLSQVYLTDANDSRTTPVDFYTNLPTGQDFGPGEGDTLVEIYRIVGKWQEWLKENDG